MKVIKSHFRIVSNGICPSRQRFLPWMWTIPIKLENVHVTIEEIQSYRFSFLAIAFIALGFTTAIQMVRFFLHSLCWPSNRWRLVPRAIFRFYFLHSQLPCWHVTMNHERWSQFLIGVNVGTYFDVADFYF